MQSLDFAEDDVKIECGGVGRRIARKAYGGRDSGRFKLLVDRRAGAYYRLTLGIGRRARRREKPMERSVQPDYRELRDAIAEYVESYPEEELETAIEKARVAIEVAIARSMEKLAPKIEAYVAAQQVREELRQQIGGSIVELRAALRALHLQTAEELRHVKSAGRTRAVSGRTESEVVAQSAR